MRNLSATLLVVLVCSVSYGQTSPGQQPSTAPATTNDSSSQQPMPPASLPQDSTTPAQGNPPASQDTKGSRVKHKLGDLTPHCIDIFAYHTCWSSPPPGKARTALPEDQAEYAKDMDVGDFYLNEKKNYMAAAMRFRDALDHKPNDPAATYMLAQSLEGLNQIDDARQVYEIYLKLEPKGKFAAQAKNALGRLQVKGVNADADKPK